MSQQKSSSRLLFWSGLLLSALGLALAYFLLPQRPGPSVRVEPIAYGDLAGWASADMVGTLAAFRESCKRFEAQPQSRAVSPRHIGGVIADWLPACTIAKDINDEKPDDVRAFFESAFQAFSLSVSDRNDGLLTGYYEPIIEGRFLPGDGFDVPLYARPPELVMVNLEAFRSDLSGRRIAGYVEAGQLLPFADRAAITTGELAGRGLEIIWLKSAVDAFFLHIQGSGRVKLPDGSLQMVGYAAQNGHSYTSIGARLIAMGEMTREDVSMQSIKAWLEADEARARDLMNQNASFVFFRLLDGENPVGSQGAPLTPGYSLAVDRTELPLGAPILLTGDRPNAADPTGPAVPFNRLVVAQDTGGAIAGTLRGDVFWGMGEDAEVIAGHMNNRAQFTLLLPRGLAEQRLAGEGQ